MRTELCRSSAYLLFFALLGSAAFSISLFEISSSLFLLFWLLAVAGEKRWQVFRGPWPAILIALAVVHWLSIMSSPFGFNGLKGAFRATRWVLLAVAVPDVIDTPQKWRSVFVSVLAIGIFIGLDALAQGLTGVEILRGRSMTAFWGDRQRITGPFPHANDFSAYLCLLFFSFAGALAAAVRQKKAKMAGGFLAGTLLTMVCLAMTYSRGAWLAVLAGLLLWAVVGRFIWPVVLIAVFVLGAYLQSPFLFKERVDGLARSWQGGTVGERWILWGEAARMIRERPILGFGSNTYSDNVERFKDPQHHTDRQYAHNGYLQIAAEIGLLGLAVFAAALFYFLATSFGTLFCGPGHGDFRIRAQGLWLGALALLAQSATDTTLQSLLLSAHLWIWAGLILSASRFLRSTA